MLGIVSEQTPKGGALTLNAISGIGMLACGAIGFPLLGLFQINTQKSELAESEIVRNALPAVVETVEGKPVLKTVTVSDGLFGTYSNVDTAALDAEIAKVTDTAKADEVKAAVAKIAEESPKHSLAKIAIFPMVMLLAYIGLFLYFKSRGGYKPVVIGDGH
jgi:hypothetical protein